jgi:hypothetical protein
MTSSPDSSLSLALCEMLYRDTPPRWAASALRAAQLLSPAWQRHEDGDPDTVLETLQTLSLLIYATASTRPHVAAPDEIPVDELLAVLDGERDINGEPTTAKAVLREGLAAAGHPRFGDAIGRLHFELTHRDAPPDVPLGMGGGAPSASALRYGVAWARDALRALDAGQDLPAVLIPQPVRLRVDGRVRVIDWQGHVYRAVTIACQGCGADRSGILTTEGADVTYTCPHQHTTHDPHLMTASRARLAITRHANGLHRILGDLLIPSPGMPATTDLRPEACGGAQFP